MKKIVLRWNRSMVSLGLSLAFVAATLGVAACNTTEGVGKDIKAAGKGIENAASDAKK